MFGYEYVNLTPEQIDLRRKQLDKAGTQAYLLPILLLSTIFILRTLTSLTPNTKPSTSPSKQPTLLTRTLRRLTWSLTSTPSLEWGSIAVQLTGTLYATALLYLAAKDTGNDYMHITKSLAHTAISQLPLHYLLAIKHPQSPITLATGLTHERLNAHHRFLGRVIHALLFAHAALYTRFFIDKAILTKRLGDWDVRYGVLAFWTANLLRGLALPSVRRRSYHALFYRSHVLLSVVLPGIVYLHVPYTRTYAAQALFFWVCNGVLRRGSMAESARVVCRSVGPRVVEVTASLGGGFNWEGWVPGMHGYLVRGRGVVGPRTPFTVVDVREREGERERERRTEVVLVVRDLGGPVTGFLGGLVVQSKTQVKPAEMELELELEGPYGEAAVYMGGLMRRVEEQVLLVAGGVGATYALPIYLALTEKRKSTKAVKFVWLVRDVEEARWGLDMLRGKSNRNVQIYVTRTSGNGKAVAPKGVEGVEISTAGARPEFDGVVETFFGAPGSSWAPMTVMVCGPPGLSGDLRRAMGRYVAGGRKVRWFEEQFGFGGS